MDGSPSSVVSLGFGSWGSPGLVLTLGFGQGEEAVVVAGPYYIDGFQFYSSGSILGFARSAGSQSGQVASGGSIVGEDQ